MRFDGDGDENFPGEWGLWESARKRAFASPHGQAKLRELREALLALPEKKLIQTRLVDATGGVCAMGALVVHKRVQEGQERDRVIAGFVDSLPDDDDDYVDTYAEEMDTIEVARQCGVRKTMAIDIAWHNDLHYKDTDEERYERVLAWVEGVIR